MNGARDCSCENFASMFDRRTVKQATQATNEEEAFPTISWIGFKTELTVPTREPNNGVATEMDLCNGQSKDLNACRGGE